MPSWDKMKIPLGYCKILNTYGTPIYVPNNTTSEDFDSIKAEIKLQLDNIEKNEPEIYKEALKRNLWKKKN